MARDEMRAATEAATADETDISGAPAGTPADAPREDALASNVHDCALVFEGGGYRGAYTAGIANALLEHEVYFDFVCGLSAGASHTVDYVSRDHTRVKEAFMARGGNQEIGGVGSFLRGKGYFNADYLYEGCVRDGALPFDFETFSANPARVAIQAFERDTGRTVVFTKKEMPDVWELLRRVRASSTLPVMMPPSPVDDRVLLDGGLGEGAGIPVHLAEKAGYERFFFVSTRPDGYRKKPPTERERAMFLRMGKNRPYLRNALLTRSERYNAELDRLAGLEREGRLMWVRPDFMPVRSTTIDPLELEQAYKMGHAQAEREMDRWTDFLFGGNA
jgi:predicted patatin/cPLA2 family phospholipase